MAQGQGETNDAICAHLYHNGFLNGLYADCILRIQSPTAQVDGIAFKLHRIFAARSPVLLDLLAKNQDEQTPVAVTLPLVDPHLTPAGLGLVLGNLYSTNANVILEQEQSPERSKMLRSVLAASHLLQMYEIGLIATNHITRDICRENLVDYCLFVSQDQYGPFGSEIRATVVDYLTRRAVDQAVLESGLVWSKPDGESYRMITQLFAQLPFEMLKSVVESLEFDVPNDRIRFSFLQHVVKIRAGKNGKTAPGAENVLLSFVKDKSGVTLVRKASNPSNRKLWKSVS